LKASKLLNCRVKCFFRVEF